MKLTWLGHSCFRIEKNGYSVIIDPYTDGSVPGLSPVRESANAVYCTHAHGDHHGVECVEIKKPEGNMPFTVKTTETYHDEVHGKKRGLNQIIMLSDSENTIVHLGDLGCDLQPDEKQSLRHADILLIPVGGFYTIDAEQAAKLAEELQPRTVIPMHYRDDKKNFGFDVIGTVDEFTDQMEGVIVLESSELDLKSLPEAKVIVLQPRNARN